MIPINEKRHYDFQGWYRSSNLILYEKHTANGLVDSFQNGYDLIVSFNHPRTIVYDYVIR